MAFLFLTKSSKHAGSEFCDSCLNSMKYIHSSLFCFYFSSLLCLFSSPLRSSTQLENYLWFMYASAAQYNHPSSYPVTRICDAIDRTYSNGTLGKIAAGVFAYRGNLSCYINEPINTTETTVGWQWQVRFLNM